MGNYIRHGNMLKLNNKFSLKFGGMNSII